MAMVHPVAARRFRAAALDDDSRPQWVRAICLKRTELRAADSCACGRAFHREKSPGQTLGEAPAPAAAGPRPVLNS